MHHIDGFDRDQITMFPETLDDYISEDNPVRFIDAFVGSLDLSSLGFRRVIPADTGRPPYHPGDLLRLYIYGYLNRVRSSRRLEKETNRNVELMWGDSLPTLKLSLTFAGTTTRQSKRCAAPLPFSVGNATCSAENSSPSDAACLRQV
jgi:transposase